jgi:hypothetical protein
LPRPRARWAGMYWCERSQVSHNPILFNTCFRQLFVAIFSTRVTAFLRRRKTRRSRRLTRLTRRGRRLTRASASRQGRRRSLRYVSMCLLSLACSPNYRFLQTMTMGSGCNQDLKPPLTKVSATVLLVGWLVGCCVCWQALPGHK